APCRARKTTRRKSPKDHMAQKQLRCGDKLRGDRQRRRPAAASAPRATPCEQREKCSSPQAAGPVNIVTSGIRVSAANPGSRPTPETTMSWTSRPRSLSARSRRLDSSACSATFHDSDVALTIGKGRRKLDPGKPDHTQQHEIYRVRSALKERDETS